MIAIFQRFRSWAETATTTGKELGMTRKHWFAGIERYILLSVIFGIVTTLIFYLGYGVSNHIEQLPIIIRSLDSTYLLNDFFTNASTDSIARLHYAEFVATLAGSEHNLPLVFLILTLCANITISVVTYYFARDLFNNSPLAGIYASAFVMSVSTFGLGWLSAIYTNILIPSTLAIPFILGAIWFLGRSNIMIGMILSGIASIFHPLFGLEVSGVLFFIFVVSFLISKQQRTRDHLTAILVSLLVFTTFSLISILPQFSQPTIDSNLFIYIIAYFRHPHHYVPSAFGLSQWVYAIAFLCAVTVLYCRSKETQEPQNSMIIAIIGFTILLLCIGGYIFVEILPMRIWVTAQTFRLLYVVKWIGLILIAGTIANKNLPSSTKMLYLASMLNPLSLGVAVLSQSLREWLERKLNWFGKILDPSFILLMIIALYKWLSIPSLSIILLSFYVVLILAFTAFPRKLLYSTFLAGTILAVVVIAYHNRLPYISQLNSVSRIANNLDLGIRSELHPEGTEVAEFVRQNTPDGSVFLTPPMWGQFRLLARRAIVVDFRAFPFADIAIAEWYERLTSCYGNPTRTGLAMIAELNENYRNIDDHTLSALQDRYHISYAVLYSQTPTHFEVVFQNNKYKVIRLGEN